MKNSVRIVLISLFTVISVCSLAQAPASAVVATDAWVKAPIPGRYMTAGFVTLQNPSQQDRQLVSVSAPWAGLIEIHTHLHEDGVMKMRQLMQLPIPAGETVTLSPGGLHLMIFKLNLPLAEPLPLTLCFDDGTCTNIDANLRQKDF
ncbi:copper chaperone PCu(A)C [Thalassolituus oleivorans]|uniref:copper chaperone PCu(A)C n=1 Tax=Thalassolituus oleivorans TaxID=187493 RepID=UPI0023F01246|nr:copper chaperone PCu(A)C [Thalassolituus oleivorans]